METEKLIKMLEIANKIDQVIGLDNFYIRDDSISLSQSGLTRCRDIVLPHGKTENLYNLSIKHPQGPGTAIIYKGTAVSHYGESCYHYHKIDPNAHVYSIVTSFYSVSQMVERIPGEKQLFCLANPENREAIENRITGIPLQIQGGHRDLYLQDKSRG